MRRRGVKALIAVFVVALSVVPLSAQQAVVGESEHAIHPSKSELKAAEDAAAAEKRLAEIEKQMAALVAQRQADQKEIATLKQAAAPKAEAPKPAAVKDSYVAVCKARGVKFDAITVASDGKVSIVCR
jgi:phage repressor protein C with HTH and peptisase S24 domain